MNEDKNHIRLMVVSLGGTPLPIIKSISAYCPEKVIFFASHDSVSQSGEIVAGIGCKPERKFEITNDPNRLSECYLAARRCIERAEQSGFSPDEIMVDYTGGTKVMSAALLMAGAGRKFRFNYVGGALRDKDGVGVVLNGHESLFAEMSPWAVWAEEERRQVVTLFNRRRYAAVVEIIDAMIDKDRPPEQIHRYFQFVRSVAEGLLGWDQFEFRQAVDRLGEGLRRLNDYLSIYPASNLSCFREQLTSALDLIREILSKTSGLRRPHPILVTDLLNNAHRRMADKQNDDAAARVYRALELYGQICFEEAAGCSNSSVEPEKIPEAIREDFARRYKDKESGFLKLPLQATFQYLEACNHDVGHRFFGMLEKIKNVQSNRNESILAHGLSPIGDHAVESIFQTVSEFVGFSENYDFPTLP